MVTDNQTLDKVYTATNHEELMDAYKDWAGAYDTDTVGRFGYVAHKASANALDKHLGSKDARILDAGCGTGLVAEVLKDMGYTNMDGLDYSQEMLDESERKGLYSKYIQADLSKPLEMRDNEYDAVVCTGTFTYGHVGPEGFEELIRVTRPEGLVTFTIRDGAYQEVNEGVGCKLCTYKIL
jgi:predicted TPR repeat methyltransferase